MKTMPSSVSITNFAALVMMLAVLLPHFLELDQLCCDGPHHQAQLIENSVNADEASGPSKGTTFDHLLSLRLFVITHCPRMWLVAALLLVSMDKIKPYSLDAIHTSALSKLPVQAFRGIL